MNRNAQALPAGLQQPATHSARLLDENELAFRQKRSVKTIRNDRWKRSGVPFLYCGPVLRHPAGPIQAANFRSAIAF